MIPDLDPALEGFTGSRTRLLTLATVASAPFPVTGYHVAKVTGLPRIKVYKELHRGVDSGLLERVEERYRFRDVEVQRLLQRRARIVSLDDWILEKQNRGGELRALSERLDHLPPPTLRYRPSLAYRGKRLKRRHPSKDAVLRELGLAESSHG